MAWTSGTVTGHKALLVALRDYLTTDSTLVAAGENWEELEYTATGFGDTGIGRINTAGYPEANYSVDSLLWLKGPGSSPGDEVFVVVGAMDETNNNLNPNWLMWGATGYIASAPDLASQPISPNLEGLPLTTGQIDYWFFANGRRVIIVAKIGTSYFSAYLGWGLPYVTPTEYPYPMFIGGSVHCNHHLHKDYNATDGEKTAFWIPAGSNSYWDGFGDALPVYSPFGYWGKGFCHRFYNGNYYTGQANAQDEFCMWPSTFVNKQVATAGESYFQFYGSHADGTPILTPISLVRTPTGDDAFRDMNPANHGLYMELEGVYLVNADDPILPEAELTIGSDTYIVFPNIASSGNAEIAAILKA